MNKIQFSEHLEMSILFDENEQRFNLKFFDGSNNIELLLSGEQLHELVDKSSNILTRSDILYKIQKIGKLPLLLSSITIQSGLGVWRMEAGIQPTRDVYIYLPDDEISLFDTEEITNACGEFMEALGFELKTEDEPIFSSFWKKIKFIFSKHVTADELDNVFTKGKKALELKHVDLPTAEQTEKLAASAEKIVSSLDKYDEGVVRLGSILVLKKRIDGNPKILIQQLNQELIKIFDEKPQLLQNLQTTYELLTGQVQNENLIDDTGTSEVTNVEL